MKTVLLVEDEENDVFLMERAFRKAAADANVQVARDGREALRYLRGEARYSNRDEHPMPSLILLDLNLPYVPGLEVLRNIRQNPKLQKLVVVVLTSSLADADIEQAYQLGANSYISKPHGLEELQDTVELLARYWLHENRPANSLVGEHAALH